MKPSSSANKTSTVDLGLGGLTLGPPDTTASSFLASNTLEPSAVSVGITLSENGQKDCAAAIEKVSWEGGLEQRESRGAGAKRGARQGAKKG